MVDIHIHRGLKIHRGGRPFLKRTEGKKTNETDKNREQGVALS